MPAPIALDLTEAYRRRDEAKRKWQLARASCDGLIGDAWEKFKQATAAVLQAELAERDEVKGDK